MSHTGINHVKSSDINIVLMYFPLTWVTVTDNGRITAALACHVCYERLSSGAHVGNIGLSLARNVF